MAEDAVRVFSHANIKEGLKQVYTKSAVPKETRELVAGLTGNIDDAGAFLRKSSAEMQKQFGQKVLAKFGGSISGQMEQLQVSKSILEREISKRVGAQSNLKSRIVELDKIISTIDDPAAKSEKIFKLNEMRDRLDEISGELVTAENKHKYIKDKLIPTVSNFHNKLKTEGYSSAVDFLKEAEVGLKNSAGSNSALLEELSRVQKFTDQINAETVKYMPEVASELLASKNLDSARAFLKEYAYNKATLSPETLSLWLSNKENTAFARKIKDSMFGAKFRDLFYKIEKTETPRKFAGSMGGRSAQEIAQSLGLPAATTGTIAGSMGVFKMFGWLMDRGIAYAGDEAKRTADKISKLQVSEAATPIVETAKQDLIDIHTASEAIEADLKDNIEKAIGEDLQNMYASLNSLVADFNRWGFVVSSSTDKHLATEIGNDIAHLLRKASQEIEKLLAAVQKSAQNQ